MTVNNVMGICQFFEEIDEHTHSFMKGLPDKMICSFISKLLTANYYTRYDYNVTCDSLPAEYEEKERKEKEMKDITSLEVLRVTLSESDDNVDSIFLECKSRGSHKFYHLTRNHTTVSLCYGKMGTAFAAPSNSFESEDKAKEFMQKKAAEKKKGGYKLVVQKNPFEDRLKEIDKILAKSGNNENINKAETAGNDKSEKKRKSAHSEKNSKETIKSVAKSMTRTEVAKLKKAEAEQLIIELGIKQKDLTTVAKMKNALNEYFESRVEDKEEEEAQEPAKKARKVEKKKHEENQEDKEDKEEEEKGNKEEEKEGEKEGKEEKEVEQEVKDVDPTALDKVFENLQGVELGKIGSVCKKWGGMLGDDNSHFWQRAYMNRWSNANPERIEKIKRIKGMSLKQHYIKQHEFDEILAKSRVAYVDKAGDAVEYLIARINNLHEPEEKYPTFPLHEKLNVEDVGDDVCYGPGYVFDVENTKKLWRLMENITAEQLDKAYQPDGKDFPKLLGGLEPSLKNRKEDLEYIRLNFLNLKILVQKAAKNGNALLRHMW